LFLPAAPVCLNRDPCFSYMAAKDACQSHQASVAELQRQLHEASHRDSELMQLREAMERIVAEKERYKVLSNSTASLSSILEL